MNNINPEIWGASAWTFLHYVTFSYPDNPTDNDMNSIKNFFENLPAVLPCEKCRLNFKSHLIKYPLTPAAISSRFDLINWLINIHNEVNLENGKPTVSYEEVIQRYLYTKKDNCLIANNRMAVIIVSVVIIVVLIFFMRCYAKKSNGKR